MADFQRVGAKSNADVGQKFEQKAVAVLAEYGIEVETDFSVDIGVSDVKKTHKFDLGREFPSVLVECKSHRWTTGGNIPSAKLTVWNEAMYYFLCAPSKYRKYCSYCGMSEQKTVNHLLNILFGRIDT